MFCPKCGAENPETNQYCRACRENLQLVSQAMKNRLPVVIASKLDQILDSRSERFRRDSLLRLLVSLAVLTGALISWQKGYSDLYDGPWLYLVMAFVFAKSALFEYRAYKRSLSPDFDWTAKDEEEVDSFAYRAGRLVWRVRRFLSSGLTTVSSNSVGLARSATKNEASTTSNSGRFAGVSIPSVTESTTRQLETGARSECQSGVIYCPRCGRAGDSGSNRCGNCELSLDLIARALQPPEQDRRTARLDRFIRRKTNGLAAASQSFNPFLYWFCLAAAVFALARSGSTPQWWYNLGLAVFFLVSGTWDRITYRRNAPEPKPATSSADAPDPPIDTSSIVESKPVIEWQRLYPDRWMLIEVTSEDESGVAEGKLIAAADDPGEFRQLETTYGDRYVVPIYGRR